MLRKDWRWQHAVERDTTLGVPRTLTILLDVDGALMGDCVVIVDPQYRSECSIKLCIDNAASSVSAAHRDRRSLNLLKYLRGSNVVR